MIFETDLDYSRLDGFTEEELLQYIRDNFISPNIKYNSGFSFKKTAKLMKAICGMLGIAPSNEQWVFLLADCERLLCEACAGAGKTTMAQLRSIKDKLVHRITGNNILALAYNTHAVEDMKAKHSAIITRINHTNIPDITRDTQLCCHTFHSFCKSWVEDYTERFGIQNKNAYLMSDADKYEAMRMALESFKKQTGKNLFVSDVMISSMLSLYSFTKETLTETKQDAWKLCPNISDVSMLTTDEIAKIFTMFNKWKKLKHKLDFSDLVDDMYILCTDPAVMKRIRANYQVFILDEYQDFTPSMLRIVKLIMEGDSTFGIEPFYNSRLTCIGDGDQSIYGFRGTDPDNCIRFKDTFNSPNQMVKVTAMSENRRCPEEILECARPVIESNAMRINKPIRSIHTGGHVEINNYHNATDEMNLIVNKLKLISAAEYKDTCICYRNQSSSFMLGLNLVQSGIPFHVAKGHTPLTDKLSQTLFEVLNMLSYPDVTSYVDRALYKVLPKSTTFTKSSISTLLSEEEINRKNGGDPNLFYQLPFPDTAIKITGFTDALQMLAKARMLHRNNKPMSLYVPDLITLIRKYYLDWQMSKSGAISDEYLAFISAWFGRSISYDDFMKEYRKILQNMEDNVGKGVCLTTFHGLKGLEFKNVFIIDLNDNIFPGTELQQAANLSVEQKDRLECEARRLFYVALTRSKHRLELFFDAELPSRYLRFFTKNTGLAKNYTDYLIDSSGYLIASVDNKADIQDDDPVASINPDVDLDLDLDITLDTNIDDIDITDIDIGSLEINDIDVEAESGEYIKDDMRIQPAETQSQVFNKIINADQQLQEVVGNENYEFIKNKTVVKSILSRFLSEERK